MNEDQHYRAPYGRAGRAQLPYELARRIAEMSLVSRAASMMVGPRVVAALLAEIDDNHRQVEALVDAMCSSGDGMLAANRERRAARQDAEIQRELAAKHADEAQRLRDRLVALHPGVTP